MWAGFSGTTRASRHKYQKPGQRTAYFENFGKYRNSLQTQPLPKWVSGEPALKARPTCHPAANFNTVVLNKLLTAGEQA